MATEKSNTDSCPVPKGTLLIIGGAEDKGQEERKKEDPHEEEDTRLEILQEFKKLIHKKEPVVEVITTASGQGAESFADYKKAFSKLGIHTVNHLHHEARKEVLDDSGLFERIRQADAFFFAGGDQLKYTAYYGGTEALTLIKRRYIHDRVVVAGTSAGAMALSTPMIYAGNSEVQEFSGMIKITTGLEFLKDVCIDTHFVHRGRVVRMAQVILTNPTCIGMGIEEDTALIIRNGLDAEVVGTGTVIVLDGTDLSESNIEAFAEKVPVVIRDLKMHILSRGCTYTIPQKNPPHV